ncbi:MAG: SRPBCC domain-containing protein [Krumholzibacteria bacterium]|nr:SRPBCC domain-containing protein [Candidatus Krumholzibacteria bacterium]
MRLLHFSITIDAPPGVVWRTMLTQETYRLWIAPFCAGTYYEGSWHAGDRIRFLTPDGRGMASAVVVSLPAERIVLSHEAMIENGVEDAAAAEANGWAGAREEYVLTPTAGGTEVSIAQDTTEEYVEMMQQTWPAALAKLKELCEEVGRPR